MKETNSDSVKSQFNFPKEEEKILKQWKDSGLVEKYLRKNDGQKKIFSFIDGPITANNPMGVHHAWGRTYKDIFQRYKNLRGYAQRFQNGFDCQGLWVEVEVEKSLGFKTKKDIESYGIDGFVKKCKERALKYSKIQTEQSVRLGQWMDWENSYYTMSDANNYAIWHFLKICQQKGLLYKGRDVVPWCPRCGTAISQHEILTEEYKEISHKAIFLKLPVVGRNKTYFVAWTTTPWTLPANVALAVNPAFEYAEVENAQGEIFILLKDKINVISNGKVLKILKGKDLLDLKYEGLFDDLPAVKESLGAYQHNIIPWEDISLEEGTGIVHIAPGCGQEDFRLSQKLKIHVINPLNNESKYLEGYDFLTDKMAADVRDSIFENLKIKGRILKIEDYLHRYPTCWRCKSELIFRLVDEWYISMEKMRAQLIEVAKTIAWIPSFGLERETDWLINMQDWLISKKRYWGLALPIYECPCGNFEVIGSREELKARAVAGWQEFEGNSPHRPWVDRVKIKCSKCDQTLSRIPDVGNPWLDAGIVSFSTIGERHSEKASYFDDKKYWKKWFPADMICESFPGQFKNWFYSLIVMSAVLEGAAPAKTIFGYALVRDEKGEEMHKSKGNAVWFDDAVDKIGADPMRWMYARQNPVNNLKFGYNAADEVKRKLLTLWNSYTFFATYVPKELVQKELSLKYQSGFFAPSNILDKWILSKLNSLIKNVTASLDSFDAARAVLSLESFFIEDLSLWYIRRSRKRLHPINLQERERDGQEETTSDDFLSASCILYAVILDLIKLIAPVVPFFAENIYQNLKCETMPESIHLWDWPIANKKMIDPRLEEKMDSVRNLVALALSERATAGIKVRQPLSKLTLKDEKLKNENELLDVLKEEVNVKEIVFDAKNQKPVELDVRINEDLKKEGNSREVARNIKEDRKKQSYTPADQIIVYRKWSNPEIEKIIDWEYVKNAANIVIFEPLTADNAPGAREIKFIEGSLWLRIEKTIAEDKK